MKITIESTDRYTTVDGVECRVWRGKTAGGSRCLVFTKMVAQVDTDDPEEFQQDLKEHPEPRELTDLWRVLSKGVDL